MQKQAEYKKKNHFEEKWFSWQGKKVSNPRPTVLETVALPAELFPYEVVIK